MLWFGEFPYLQHTIANSEKLMSVVLVEKNIAPSMILTITPDGAADVVPVGSK